MLFFVGNGVLADALEGEGIPSKGSKL